MAATLEEEIEWLSCTTTRCRLEAGAHSQRQDHCRWRSRGQKRRHCQVWLKDCHGPYFEYHPSWGDSEPEENEEAPKDFNLEDLLELGPEINCFLWGPVESSNEDDRQTPSPKPPIEELESWVIWRARMYETPGWWQELANVPGVDNHGKLACEV